MKKPTVARLTRLHHPFFRLIVIVDNYGSLKTPVFGSVCAAFQGHHVTPWTITFRSFA
jgi:hypothetical protein